MYKFLIINPFGIGDVLFTTPAIKALKEKFPDCVIGYWCNERVGGLLESNPDINKIFALSRGDIKRVYKGFPIKGFIALFNLIREIKKEKFDTTLDFSLDSRYGLCSKLAGIKKRVGFDYNGRGRFLTKRIDLKGYSEKHVVEYYGDLLKFLDIGFKERSLSLKVSDTDKAMARERLAEYGVKPFDMVVAVAMGGGMSWGKAAIYKQWPAKNFSGLAERLIKDSGARIVLLGSADERPIADIIVNNLKYGNIVDLTGKLTLVELAAMIKESKLLVCNDGGPLHMAVALDVKTVSVFGPVDEKVYGPYPSNPDHIVIKKDLACRPCYENFRFKGCFNERRCLEDVTVDEVYEKVKSLLKNSINMSLRGAEGDEAI